MNISDKVVCVDDVFPPWVASRFCGQLPREGELYVVRGYRIGRMADGRTPLHIFIVGIEGYPDSQSGEEVGFSPHRFRKLDDIKEENRLRQQRPHALKPTEANNMPANQGGAK